MSTLSNFIIPSHDLKDIQVFFEVIKQVGLYFRAAALSAFGPDAGVCWHQLRAVFTKAHFKATIRHFLSLANIFVGIAGKRHSAACHHMVGPWRIT